VHLIPVFLLCLLFPLSFIPKYFGVSCLLLHILLNQMAALVFSNFSFGVFCGCYRFLPVRPLLFNTCTVHLLKCITNNCTEIFLNLTFRGPYIVIYFYSKTNQMHNISNLFYFGTTLYMFRTVSPSIIRSLRLYIQHQVCHKGSVKVVTTVNIVLWRLASCSLLAKHRRLKKKPTVCILPERWRKQIPLNTTTANACISYSWIFFTL